MSVVTSLNPDFVGRQIGREYQSTRNSVIALCIIQLIVAIAAAVAYGYYLPTADYSNTRDPTDPCYYQFPIWKQQVVGILLGASALFSIYTIWTTMEQGAFSIRMNIYTTLIRWLILIVYIIALIVVALAYLTCNAPYIFFNVCNDRNWPCAYIAVNGTMPTCPSECHGSGVGGIMNANELSPNMGFLVFMSATIVLAVLGIITILMMQVYKDRKSAYIGSGIPADLLFRLTGLELAWTAVAQAVVVFLCFGVAIGTAIYCLATGAFPVPAGSEWRPMAVIYMIWTAIEMIAPIMAATAIFPVIWYSSKEMANIVMALWAAMNLALLAVAGVFYLICYWGILSNTYCDSASTSPIFASISVSTCILFVIQSVAAILFLASRRLLRRLGNVSPDSDDDADT
jgi:hypothetical protein